MKKVLIGLLLLTCCVNVVSANLGESVEEIEKRYGKPTQASEPEKPETSAAFYEKTGCAILVGFVKDKSYCETYMNLDKSDLSEAQVEAFLKANAGESSKWKKLPESMNINTFWERSDGDIIAELDWKKQILVINHKTERFDEIKGSYEKAHPPNEEGQK